MVTQTLDPTSTYPATGVPADPGSQAPAPLPQGTEQGQQAGPPPVEGQEPQPSSEEPERAKPSDFYKQRNRVQRLEQQLAQQSQRMEQFMSSLQSQFNQPAPKPSVSQEQPFGGITPQQFWADPVGNMQKIQQQIAESVRAQMQQEIPQTFQEVNAQRDARIAMQEAGSLIQSNEMYRKDPNGKERMADILFSSEYELEEISKYFPRSAARLALAIYENQVKGGPASAPVARPANPYAPSKGQMRSTATGTQAGVQVDLNAEFKKLQDEIAANDQVIYDPKWQERYQLALSRVAQNPSSQLLR